MCQAGYGENPRIMPDIPQDARTQPAILIADKLPLGFKDLPPVPGLKLYNLECEVYREYDFGGRVYRISDPVGFYQREGGTTHRVVDREGMTHCVPAVGYNGCALRWVDRDPKTPVKF